MRTRALRLAARVLLLNEKNEVLLLQYEEQISSDPEREGPRSFWVLPGGGVEPQESFEAAALRELAEETGVRLDAIGPCVFTRDFRWRIDDVVRDCHERLFVGRVERSPQSFVNATPIELITQTRWWSAEELKQSTEAIYPPGLAELLENASTHLA